MPLPANPQTSDDDLRRALAQFADAVPDAAADVALFVELLDDPENPFVRARLAGHFTGSAWLVSADGRRVLLTHHRKHGRWLQLGGHADGDRDLARVALREAEEESGLADLVVDPAIFDLDRHWIPERGSEPGHWHYDIRHVVRATGAETFTVGEESLDLAWKDIATIAADETADASLRRMARRWVEQMAQDL